MQERLQQLLYGYLVDHHLDLVITLQQERKLTDYISDKVKGIDALINELLNDDRPPYIIEELCLERLTEDIRPSKFNYIRQVLATEFETQYGDLAEAGLLTYEVINMISACQPVFDELGFSINNEDDREIYHAVTGTIARYLEKDAGRIA